MSEDVALFISFKICRKIPKEPIKARVIEVRIDKVSNYKRPIAKSSNWTPVIGHPCYRAPTNRRAEPMMIENFVIDTTYAIIYFLYTLHTINKVLCENFSAHIGLTQIFKVSVS